MRRGRIITGVVVAFVAVVSVGSFITYRLAKWALGDAHPAHPSGQAAPFHSAPSSPKILSPHLVIRGGAMAEAFRSGRLPTPLPPTPGAPEQAAAELAKRVIAEDEQSTAALLTALQMSGFSVRAEDGSMAVESVTPGQGIVMDAWEAAALAKLFGDGMQISLADFSNALANTIRPLKDAPVAALFLDGLRAAAQGDEPAKRFWASFIAELGRQSAKPYDLLAPDVDPAKINLDAIQVSLILRRLVVDLMILDKNPSQKAELRPAWDDDWTTAKWKPASCRFNGGLKPFVRDAVWQPEDGPRLLLVQEQGGDSQLPCTLAELAAQIMDASAYLTGKGFDTLIEYLKEHGMEGAGKYGVATSVVNGILAVIKLLCYYACLETNIAMSGEPPLVRTQSIYQPGEKRTLTASVRENIGKWQAMNCVRLALNAANIAFSLPNDGPQPGVEIQWVLVGGGVSISHDTGEITWPFVELVFPDGSPLIQNATGPTSNATAPKTDEEGHATIDIEGLKQKEELVKPLPLMKQAEVRFTCAPKPIGMTQDLIDAVGQGFLAGPVGLIVGGPVEMLLRSNIHFSKPLLIPVKDWQTCDGGWGGSITYTMSIHSLHKISASTHNSTEGDDHAEHEEIELHGNANSGPGWEGSSHGTFSASVENKWLGVDRWPTVGCTITTEKTLSASGGGETDVTISPMGSGKYQLGAAAVNIPSTSTRHATTSGCKGTPPPDEHNSGNSMMGIPSVTVQEDPDQPGVLQGSTTLPNTTPGMTITIQYNLVQCPGSR